MNHKSTRTAACAIPIRPCQTAPGYEVLLVRRSPALRFLGGFDAFPGGVVDPSDDVDGFEDGPQRAAALRELAEETGIEGHSPQDLIPMGRWRTPPYTPVVYDARYYAVWVAADVSIHLDPGELTEYHWQTPHGAIDAHEEGRLRITYPVLETLRVMAAHGSNLEATSQQMQARSEEPYPHAGGEMLDGVHVVPVRTPTLPPATHTNTYVLGSSELVVVDPATPYEDEQARLLEYLQYLSTQGHRVREIWLTHHHHDHVGAVNWLKDALNVPVAAHPITAKLLAPKISVDRLMEDGSITELPRKKGPPARWQALHTPGHTQGHLCFYETTRHTLISGDLILGSGTVLVAPPEGNMQAYMASLQRLRQMPIGFLFPAHGPPVAAAHHKIDMYIAHRTMRENAILRALEQPATPKGIVQRVYTDVDPKAYALAELNVLAHLEKLMHEGKVQQHADTFVRIN